MYVKVVLTDISTAVNNDATNLKRRSTGDITIRIIILQKWKVLLYCAIVT